ncbi:response regulator transcription factor [Helicobacter sp. 23-1045]
MIKILMIEDNCELAEILSEFLTKHNISVENYTDPILGIKALSNGKYDLMLLDLTLPNMDGLDVCKQVASTKNIPIIISSARSDIDDKITALEYGADDYLPKPYNPKELLARIYSVLRRYSIIPTNDATSNDFALNKDEKAIYFKGERLKLTRAEFEMMAMFLNKPNVIFSREDIVNSCKSLKKAEDSKSIDVIVGRLRSKLGDKKEQKYIISVRGMGYKFSL